MVARTFHEVIESNLLWHRSEGGDREALVRGMAFWSDADLERLYALLEDELRARAGDVQLVHIDELELWLGEGQ